MLALKVRFMPSNTVLNFNRSVALTALLCCGTAFSQSADLLQTQTISNTSYSYTTESIAIDGNKALVAHGSGAIFYTLDGGRWKVVTDASADTSQAYSVSLSGDYAVVGVREGRGAALVYEYRDNSWTKVSVFDLAGQFDSLNYGDAVAIDGNYMVVASDDKAKTGAVYVYERLAGAWTQVAELYASDAADYDRFGGSVSISGNTIVVGAKQEDNSNGRTAGSAYVFQRNGGGWTEVAKLTASDGAKDDEFGSSVAVNGGRIVVSAYLADLNSLSNAGAVYVFEGSGSNWTETAKLTSQAPAAYSFFGKTLSIDADRIVLDTREIDKLVYVYDYIAGIWSESYVLRPSNNARGFGIAMAVSENNVIVGSEVQGTAYYYSLNQTAECIDSDGDGFGWDGTRSCRVNGTAPPTASNCIDSDGDGYGWDGVKTCIVDSPVVTATCIDSDGDGYGWDGVKTCIVGAPVTTRVCVDSDGDGYGWDGLKTCLP